MSREVVIKLSLEEIKYEVKFDSWVKGRISNENLHNSNKDAESIGIAYDSDKAEDWLLRQINDAVGTLHSELSWAVCNAEEPKLTTDELEEQSEWCIHLIFGKNWCGNPRALNTFAHKYVVNYILSMWYRAESLKDYPIYKDEADKAIKSLYMEARSEKVELEPWRL